MTQEPKTFDKRSSPHTIRAWSEKRTIIDRYEAGEDAVAIGKSYNVSQPFIHNLLKVNGIKMRPHSEWSKYKLNRDYFEKIDSHEKAQILGFLYADGCIAENRDSYKLQIVLHEKDVEYLKHIKKCLGYTGPIRRFKARVAHHVVLVIHSKKMGEDLIKLGVFPRKTFKVRFPTEDIVPKEFLSSFVLGFFEGDGSINTFTSIYKKTGQIYKIPRISLVGRKNMVEAIKSMMSLSNKLEKRGRIYALAFTKLDNVKKFVNYIYENAVFVMKRKYLRAAHLLTNINPLFYANQATT